MKTDNILFFFAGLAAAWFVLKQRNPLPALPPETLPALPEYQEYGGTLVTSLPGDLGKNNYISGIAPTRTAIHRCNRYL